MADNEQEETPKKPPKIKMDQTNGNGLPRPKLPSEGIEEAATAATPGDDTTRISLDDTAGKKPAKTNLNPKEDTTRIDLPSMPKPVGKPPGKSQTARLDLSAAKPPKKPKDEEDTARIDLKKGSARKPDTARIDLADTFEATQPIGEAGASDTQPVEPVASPRSSETARIKLESATPPPEETEPVAPSEAPTRGIAQLTEEERDEILKQSTLRVDLDAAEVEAAREREALLKQTTSPVAPEGIEAEEKKPSGAQNKTMRVELDQEVAKAKSQTARIELPEDADKAASARISIKEGGADEDVFKRHAAAAAAASIAATAAPKSETARTEVEEPVSAPDPEAGKSKTARIEMPDEVVNAPAGRPKTIKIKRADTAQPMRATAAPAAGVKRSKKKGSTEAAADSEVGTLYSILAIASVVVIGVLLYVLAAQTVAPGLPFIGKIG